MSALLARFAPLRARSNAYFAQHRSLGVLVAVIVIGGALPLMSRIPPFGELQSMNAWVNAFTIAGIYALLAVGLNVVIGFAGLLDLGYAAFFALGGYTYAIVASPFFDIHLPFWPMLILERSLVPCSASSSAPQRCGCAVTTWPL